MLTLHFLNAWVNLGLFYNECAILCENGNVHVYLTSLCAINNTKVAIVVALYVELFEMLCLDYIVHCVCDFVCCNFCVIIYESSAL